MDEEQRLRARASLLHMLQETEQLRRLLGLEPEDFPAAFRMLYPDPFPPKTGETITKMGREHPRQQSMPQPKVVLAGSYVLLQIGDEERKTYYIAASNTDAYRTHRDPFNPHGSPPTMVLYNSSFGLLLT